MDMLANFAREKSLVVFVREQKLDEDQKQNQISPHWKLRSQALKKVWSSYRIWKLSLGSDQAGILLTTLSLVAGNGIFPLVQIFEKDNRAGRVRIKFFAKQMRKGAGGTGGDSTAPYYLSDNLHGSWRTSQSPSPPPLAQLRMAER